MGLSSLLGGLVGLLMFAAMAAGVGIIVLAFTISMWAAVYLGGFILLGAHLWRIAKRDVARKQEIPPKYLVVQIPKASVPVVKKARGPKFGAAFFNDDSDPNLPSSLD
jgi:hypothetical protein